MELQLNGGAHTLKILFDLQVRKAKDPNPFYSLKVIGSDCILLRPLSMMRGYPSRQGRNTPSDLPHMPVSHITRPLTPKRDNALP